MGIWDKLEKHAKAQFLDVIQWEEDDRHTLVYKFPIFNQAIQDGSKLVVREGQVAVFLHEGKLSQVFGPGTYDLSTKTEAIWSFFESIKYALDYPYKGDVFFMSTRQFTDQKWGTPSPFLLQDSEIGPVRVRAFGIYAYRIQEPATFLTEIVGNTGLLTTAEINGQLKRKLVSAFADTVSESKIPVFQLTAQYMEIGEALCGQLSSWFEKNYGIRLTDFVVENISLPPEVEKMLDKRSSMGILGDMNKFTQFQTANAIESAAGKTGGGSNALLDAGMGLAMGQMMGQQLAGATAPAATGAAVPPPAPSAEPTFHYNGPNGQSQLPAAAIAQLVSAAPGQRHLVWKAGFDGWKSATDVPDISQHMGPPPVPPADGPPAVPPPVPPPVDSE